jgi:hypothetical protein
VELRNLSRPFVLSLIAKHEPIRAADLQGRIEHLPVTLSLGPDLTVAGLLTLMEKQRVLARDKGKLMLTPLGHSILREVSSPLLDEVLTGG